MFAMIMEVGILLYLLWKNQWKLDTSLNELVCLIKIDSYMCLLACAKLHVAHLSTAPIKAACEVQHFSWLPPVNGFKLIHQTNLHIIMHWSTINRLQLLHIAPIQSIATILHSLQAMGVPEIVIVIAGIPVHPAIVVIPVHPAIVTVGISISKLRKVHHLLRWLHPSFASWALHPW